MTDGGEDIVSTFEVTDRFDWALTEFRASHGREEHEAVYEYVIEGGKGFSEEIVTYYVGDDPVGERTEWWPADAKKELVTRAHEPIEVFCRERHASGFRTDLDVFDRRTA